MDARWIYIHEEEGILKVPSFEDIPTGDGLMWLMVNSDDRLCTIPVNDQMETGWWSRKKAWYSRPIVSTRRICSESHDISPWVRSSERGPGEPDRFILVFYAGTHAFAFVSAMEIKPSPSVYWYDGEVTATLFKV